MENESLVEEHRKMVALTGNVSDFQLTNLKQWPFVLFDDLRKAQVDYDFTSGIENTGVCAGSVSYDFYFKEEPSEENLKFKLDQLILWTKFLFWKDTEVHFKKQGKKWEI